MNICGVNLCKYHIQYKISMDPLIRQSNAELKNVFIQEMKQDPRYTEVCEYLERQRIPAQYRLDPDQDAEMKEPPLDPIQEAPGVAAATPLQSSNKIPLQQMQQTAAAGASSSNPAGSAHSRPKAPPTLPPSTPPNLAGQPTPGQTQTGPGGGSSSSAGPAGGSCSSAGPALYSEIQCEPRHPRL